MHVHVGDAKLSSGIFCTGFDPNLNEFFKKS